MNCELGHVLFPHLANDLLFKFDNETAIYEPLETSQAAESYLFHNFIARRQARCSSLFPADYVILIEY